MHKTVKEVRELLGEEATHATVAFAVKLISYLLENAANSLLTLPSALRYTPLLKALVDPSSCEDRKQN